MCIILFAKFISNFVNSYHLYNCQGPGGWPSELPINHMTLAKLCSSDASRYSHHAIARVTDDSIVGIMKGYTADDLSEAQTRLVGHDQSSNPPKNFDINTCCPECFMKRGGVQAKMETKEYVPYPMKKSCGTILVYHTVVIQSAIRS